MIKTFLETDLHNALVQNALKPVFVQLDHGNNQTFDLAKVVRFRPDDLHDFLVQLLIAHAGDLRNLDAVPVQDRNIQQPLEILVRVETNIRV